MFTISVAVTAVFYTLIVYVSYITSQILYFGITSRLWMPILKSSLFILVSYTSIISDVILFSNCMYESTLLKNGLLLLLLGTSLITAASGKETNDAHNGE